MEVKMPVGSKAEVAARGKCRLAGWVRRSRNPPSFHGKCHCDLSTVFPKVISGRRRPIAIQAAISLNMALPE